VQHNAQLAMIGVSLIGVKVRYLREGEQRQQNQAHDRNDRHKSRPRAASTSEYWPESYQRVVPSGSILQKARKELDENILMRLYLSQADPAKRHCVAGCV
jgi:hypothetical protein